MLYWMANISLTKQQESFIKKEVRSGRYVSSSEVVRDALRMLEDERRTQQNKLAMLRVDLKQGISDLTDGKSKTSQAVFARARKKLARNT